MPHQPASSADQPAGSSGTSPPTPGGWTTRKSLRRAVVLAVFLAGVSSSFLAGWVVKRTIENEAKAHFDGVSDEVTTRIRERLNAYALMLQGSQAFFATSQEVTREQWRSYVDTLRAWKTAPGYLAIGFTQLVTQEDLHDHIRKIRSEGFPDYQIHPPGPRDNYAPTVFIEPFAGRNLHAFGYDMYSEPVRRRAMERALTSGEAALSGKVTLVQEDSQDEQPGSLMYVDVYRKGAPTRTPHEKRAATLGWIYCSYRLNDLMTEIVQEWSLPGHKAFSLRIYDGDNTSADNLLFESHAGAPPDPMPLSLSARRVIDFNGTRWLLDFHAQGADGDIRYILAWAGTIGGVVISTLLAGLLLLVFKHLDAQRTAENLAETIRGMAFHDSLTKLPNRLLLQDRLEMALAASRRGGNHGAVMMVDLDNFKPLNDRHGHAAGDLLLIEVAQRIRDCVRGTDTVARIGGDEFVVLLAGLTGGQDAAQLEAKTVAEKIRSTLSLPYLVGAGIEHLCPSSIGITLFTGAETGQSSILRRADAAMYVAKFAGGNQTRFYTPGDENAYSSLR